MKRLVLAPLAVALVLSGAVGASASTLSKQLIGASELSGSWSAYGVSGADLTGCPESLFTRSSGSASAFFVQRGAQSLVAEKLVASTSAASAYASAVARMSTCHAPKSVAGDSMTVRISPLSLGRSDGPERAFAVTSVVGGTRVTGEVVVARKGNVVVELAEATLASFSRQRFKSDLDIALAKIRA